MLKNNLTALENSAVLDGADIKKAVLKGAFLDDSVAECLFNLEKKPPAVAASLHNADCKGVFRSLPSMNPAGIIAGFRSICKLTGAEKGILMLPEQDKEAETLLLDLAENNNLDLSIEYGSLLDVRKHENDIKVSISDLLSISDALSNEPAKAVIVKEGVFEEYELGTKISDIVGEDDGIKGVCINHSFYTADILEKPLSRAFVPKDGIIAPVKESRCILQAAQEDIDELHKKSCGKCTFCREGMFQLSAILKDLINARSKASELELALEICDALPGSVMCDLGIHASFPVFSVLQSFKDEAEAHIRKKNCPSGECRAFLSLYIDPSLCQGCGDCMDVCPENCIEGRSGFISLIDEFDCSKCGKCVDVCPEKAVKYSSGRTPALPLRPTRVGRFRGR